MSYIMTNPSYFENFTSVEVYMNDTQVATQTYDSTTLYTVQKGNRIKFLAKGVDASKKSLFQGINFYGGSSGTTPANITIISSDWVTDSPNDYQIIFDIDASYSADFRAVTSFSEAPSTHTVTFYDGTTLLKSVEVEDGTLFPTQELPETPTRQGKVFYAWSSTSEYYTYFDFLNTTISADTDLYAFFNNIVDLQYNGGHVEGSQATHKNVPTDPDTGKIIAAQMPTVVKSGYTLTYWVKDDTTKYTPEELEDIVFDANTTLTAQWEMNKYTVTFKEGDETIATIEVIHGNTVNAIEPEHTTDESGKEFVYWMDENDAEFDFTTPITEDITLTAYYAQAGSSKWIMSLPNCFVGLKSDVADLPIARVENGTKALAISANEGEETAYIFHKASLTWIELQNYTVNI